MEDHQKLLSILTQSQNRLSQWTKECKKLLGDLIINEDQEKKKKQISTLEENIEATLTSLEGAATDQKHSIQGLEKQLEQHNVQKEAQERLINILHEELQHLSQERDMISKVVESSDINSKKEKIQRLEKEDAMFKKYLALEINKVKGGWLQLVFTNIDQSKMDSPYMLSLQVTADKKYIVGDCQPQILGMDALLDELNQSNNFHRFVHAIRRRFKEMT